MFRALALEISALLGEQQAMNVERSVLQMCLWNCQIRRSKTSVNIAHGRNNQNAIFLPSDQRSFFCVPNLNVVVTNECATII